MSHTHAYTWIDWWMVKSYESMKNPDETQWVWSPALSWPALFLPSSFLRSIQPHILVGQRWHKSSSFVFLSTSIQFVCFVALIVWVFVCVCSVLLMVPNRNTTFTMIEIKWYSMHLILIYACVGVEFQGLRVSMLLLSIFCFVFYFSVLSWLLLFHFQFCHGWYLLESFISSCALSLFLFCSERKRWHNTSRNGQFVWHIVC